MDVTPEVNKFGWVLLPKELREALRLQPGDELQAHLDGMQLIVTPVPRLAPPREQNGFLIIDLPDETLSQDDPVQNAREARDSGILSEMAQRKA